MLEILKELQKGTILEFSNEDIIDFIESDSILGLCRNYGRLDKNNPFRQ
jgi:hypothetical protein